MTDLKELACVKFCFKLGENAIKVY